MSRIVFNLLTELGNVNIDGTCIHRFCIFVTPDLAEEFRTRNGVVSVVPKVFKNLNFLAGKCQFFCTAHARVFTEVHAEEKRNNRIIYRI